MSLVLCLLMERGVAHWRSILFCMTTTQNAKREMEKENQAVYLEGGSLFTKRLYSLSASEEYDIGIAV
jgi:hypothetical protein